MSLKIFTNSTSSQIHPLLGHPLSPILGVISLKLSRKHTRVHTIDAESEHFQIFHALSLSVSAWICSVRSDISRHFDLMLELCSRMTPCVATSFLRRLASLRILSSSWMSESEVRSGSDDCSRCQSSVDVSAWVTSNGEGIL